MTDNKRVDYGLRLTLLVVAGFSLMNALVRRLAGDSLSMDDAKTNLFTQVWQWGYQPDNPPLFEWLTKLLHLMTTGDIWSFLILKYLALIAAAGFVHATVRIYSNERTACWTAIGMVTLYQIGWNFHQAFTHSALMLPAIAAMIWTGLRAFREPTFQRIIILGITTGIALLTKYNAALFIIGFLMAGVANPRIRAVMLSKRALLIPVIAGVIILPHVIWFLNQSDAYKQTLDVTMGLGGSYMGRLAGGVESLLVGIISFFLPWILIAIPLAKGRGLVWHSEERLLIRTSMMVLAVLTAAIIFFGIGSVSERYLIPVLLPAYIGVTSSVLNAQSNFRTWMIACAIFAFIITGLRTVTYLSPGPPFCEECREFVPYAELSGVVSDMVPTGAVLLVREENTGGNMVASFPESPVRVLTSLRMTNPVRDEGRPCYYIWSEDMVGGVPLHKDFEYAHTDPRTVMVEAPWRHPFRETGFRQTVWGITPIDDPRLYAQYCARADG